MIGKDEVTIDELISQVAKVCSTYVAPRSTEQKIIELTRGRGKREKSEY